ncbi:MAG TPA: 2-oxoglutarate dehydrogenase E1 component [Chlamydiales bacterium]|nr:2-oxoglutarate dehydrogenase E1 component [Chlamydiales bacterium]
MPKFPDHAQLANIGLIEELYQRYLSDPESVDLSWKHFFEGIDFGTYLAKRGVAEPKGDLSALRIGHLVHEYRRYGHLAAHFNPVETEEGDVPELELEKLGFFKEELEAVFPTLGFCGKGEAPLREIIEALRGIYCGRIGFEFQDETSREVAGWIQQHIEPQLIIQPTIEEKHLLLEYLNKSEVLETFLHMRYVGQTRFSLEGGETMIPLLAEIMTEGGGLGVNEFVIGMAHRGRLNIIANILNKPLPSIFEEFEDDTTLSFAGNDDVKYHMGFSGEITTRKGKKIPVSIAANPSHLESVDPVVLGEVKAKQVFKDQEQVCPILIHGDASLAGQGVIYEALQLMNLPSYSVGGTLHIVINNQIGYTTLPEEGRSTRYCTDIAKTFSCPVFHVNAEDPESCLFIGKLAMQIRQKFKCDVFIDLLCYRKYGHNEGDEPSYTQPLQYKLIRSKKPIRQIYYEQLIQQGQLEQKLAEALETQFKEDLKKALSQAQAKKSKPPEKGVEQPLFEPFKSGVDAATLQSVAEIFCKVPEGFHLHPKLQKWLQDRLNAVKSGKGIDWATGECLAFGSLLKQKVRVRLAGQDSKRGTFSQRHMIWVDTETSQFYCPLCQIKEGRFEAVNSPLTEFAGLGFEYGYSWGDANALVLWEAQYGDFDNGAQVVIDQYIATGEQKWNAPSSIALLLPHGYEGAGPEHSSARPERFLQLAASNNIQVVNATTPAQYFHLLRRQALRKIKKPLIVLTPKSLLRAPVCTSSINEFTSGQFEEILDDSISQCKRLLFCSGKVYYDLIAEREKRKMTSVAIVRVEQLYPLHIEKLKKTIAKYKGFTECFWVQEEPENMGAWNFIGPYLQAYLPKGILLQYAGRAASPTTATGSHMKHKQEQQSLLDQALG